MWEGIQMSREILQRIGLEFPSKFKTEVRTLLEKDFKEDMWIIKENLYFIIVEVSNSDIDEDSFEDYKKYCTYIGLTEYECYDEGGFIWEKDE